MQRPGRRHRTVGGVDPSAGENKFPRQEHVARVTAAKKDFRFALGLINNDKRGGILGLYPRVETDALSVDQMARNRRHSLFYPRGRERIINPS